MSKALTYACSRRDPSCHPRAVPKSTGKATCYDRALLYTDSILQASVLQNGKLQWLPLVNMVHLSLVQDFEPEDRCGDREHR